MKGLTAHDQDRTLVGDGVVRGPFRLREYVANVVPIALRADLSEFMSRCSRLFKSPDGSTESVALSLRFHAQQVRRLVLRLTCRDLNEVRLARREAT